MNKHKPTSEERKIIRQCACREAGYGAVELCPSTKYNLNDHTIPNHMNIAFVTKDLVGWNDTDLADNSFTWNDFARGVELTKDGDGMFDFYIYGPLGYHKELQGNVVATYKSGKLVLVEGTARGVLWKAE